MKPCYTQGMKRYYDKALAALLDMLQIKIRRYEQA